MEREIRFHGRGGQGVVTASKLLAEIAFLSGFKSQSIPFFGAERRGSPVSAFTRVSTKEIRKRSLVYYADYIVVFDPRIREAFKWLKKDCYVIVNSEKEPKINLGCSVNLVTVDATSIAIKHGLFISESPAVNIPMLGALLKVFPEIKKNFAEDVVRRFGEEYVEAFRDSYKTASVKKVKGSKVADEIEKKKAKVVKFPISTPSIGVAGKTSLWRDFRPEIDYNLCNDCLNCWLHCPEAAVKIERKIEIDYDFCKGCLICYEVCSKGAIRVVREVII